MFKTISSCRACYGPIELMVDLGKQPLADAFITSPEKEEAFPLRAGVCAHCKLVQLIDEVDKDLLFNDDYGFFTGASPSSIAYFKEYAESVLREYPSDGLHVEIASNDGTLLKHFLNAGKPVLGVDPAGNTVSEAIAQGVPSITAHFSKETAEHIIKSEGRADVIMANNVVAHVSNLHNFLDGVHNLLTDSGVFIAEVQYFPHLLFNNSFDHMYHEHRSFFSFAPLQKLFHLHGLNVVRVIEADTQGGSIRVYAKKDFLSPVDDSVYDLLNYETKIGIGRMDTYVGFQQRIDYIKKKLLDTLVNLRGKGKVVHGFGASAKGNTLLNYCGIGPDLMPVIEDLTPYKMGKLSPGMHIPVVNPGDVAKPDYYLLLVWNYLSGVLVRNKQFLDNGGHFIVPIPTPIII